MASVVAILAGVGALIVFLFFIGLGIYAKRYHKVPPNQAMVVYGSKMKENKRGFMVITGGGRFIRPIVEDVAFLPLDVRTLDIKVRDIVTDVKISGAKVNIQAVTQIKIGSDTASLMIAAEQLLHKTDAQINEIATKTLEGHVRGICATMTIEAINSDRDEISSGVQRQAAKDLRNMGIEIRSFVIKEIEDEKGYLDALGRKRTAEVKRDARMGEATANQQATIREASAAREGEKANAQAESEVAKYHMQRDIIRQQAEAKVEIEKANREIAFDLQDRKRRQELVQEEVMIQIRKKEKQIELQEREIERSRKEQEALKVVPAKADAEAKIAEAEGTKGRTIKLSEAEKEKLRLVAEGEKEKRISIAEGEAQKIRKEGTAEADIIKLRGEAEASAIRAKGIAEAEAMEKKAAAWKKYGSAAVTQMIVEQLPNIVRQASLPLEGVDKIIVMGNEGPSGLVNKTVNIAAQMPALVKSLTGMDLVQLVGDVTKSRSDSQVELIDLDD